MMMMEMIVMTPKIMRIWLWWWLWWRWLFYRREFGPQGVWENKQMKWKFNSLENHEDNNNEVKTVVDGDDDTRPGPWDLESHWYPDLKDTQSTGPFQLLYLKFTLRPWPESETKLATLYNLWRRCESSFCWHETDGWEQKDGRRPTTKASCGQQQILSSSVNKQVDCLKIIDFTRN